MSLAKLPCSRRFGSPAVPGGGAADEKYQLVAEPPRTSNEHPIAEPNGVFECADGFMLIATFNDREFAQLAQAPGRAD